MKAIIKVRFKAIDYYTMKRIAFTKLLTADGLNFTDTQTKPLSVNGGEFTLPSVTIKAAKHADNWISEQSTILDGIINDPKRELNCILNWEVISIENVSEKGESNVISTAKVTPINKEEKVNAILSIITTERGKELDPQFKADFYHTYTEMKDAISGLPAEKQISVVLSAMGVGMMAASTAYTHMSNILKGEPTEETKLIN